MFFEAYRNHFDVIYGIDVTTTDKKEIFRLKRSSCVVNFWVLELVVDLRTSWLGEIGDISCYINQ